MLGTLLSKLKETRTLILSMDAHSAHLSPKAFVAGHKAGFLIHTIPANMTSVLQPLDTHVLSRPQCLLWNRRQEKLLASASGRLHHEEYLDAICGVVSEVFSVCYPQAFTSCGFNTIQEGVSARVLNALQWSEVPIAGAGLPTLAELQHIWPGNGSRQIPVMQLLRPFLHEPRVPRGRITLRQAAL